MAFEIPCENKSLFIKHLSIETRTPLPQAKVRVCGGFVWYFKAWFACGDGDILGCISIDTCLPVYSSQSFLHLITGILMHSLAVLCTSFDIWL